MKFQLLLILLFSVSLVSAVDCWQLTNENGEYECLYLTFDNCNETYYDEFYDCERDRLDIALKTDNVIQKFTEKTFPDYESETLSKLYNLSNVQLLFICLFCYLLYWIFENR